MIFWGVIRTRKTTKVVWEMTISHKYFLYAERWFFMKNIKVVLFTIAFTILGSVSVFADENGLKINKKTFPDWGVRNELARHDTNKNQILEKKELKKLTKLDIRKYLDPDDVDEDEDVPVPRYKKNEFVFDFTGLEKLTYLQELNICLVNGYTSKGVHYPSVVQNIEKLYEMKNLKKLELHHISTKSLDTSKFPKLRKLVIDYNPNLEELILNKKVKNLHLEALEKLKQLDIRGFKNLKQCFIGGNFKKLSLSRCKKLEELYVFGNVDQLDITKLKNLKEIYLDNGKIKKVDFTKNKELKVVSTNWMTIKKLNLSKNKKLTEVSVDGSGVKKIVLPKNNKIKWFRWANSKVPKGKLSLKKLRLNPKYLETVILYEDKNLKSIDIRKYPKIKEVYGDNLKIIKKQKQVIEE